MKSHDTINDIAANCLMSASRRLSRVLSSLYDEELRPHRVKASQLHLLVVVAKAGPIRRADISRIADIDPSTLTRNLSVMISNKWVEDAVTGEDGRGSPVQITRRGRELIESTAPAWKRAQQRARKLLGGDLAAATLLGLSRGQLA